MTTTAGRPLEQDHHLRRGTTCTRRPLQQDYHLSKEPLEQGTTWARDHLSRRNYWAGGLLESVDLLSRRTTVLQQKDHLNRRNTWAGGSLEHEDHLSRRISWVGGPLEPEDPLSRRTTWAEGPLEQDEHLSRRFTWAEGSLEQEEHLSRRNTWAERYLDRGPLEQEETLSRTTWAGGTLQHGPLSKLSFEHKDHLSWWDQLGSRTHYYDRMTIWKDDYRTIWWKWSGSMPGPLQHGSVRHFLHGDRP
jgi:hypothetical protein